MPYSFPNSTRNVFRQIGGLRRPAAPPAAKTPTPKPFYKQSAKEQERQYLKIAGGQKYFKTALKLGLKKELKDFEHHRYGEMTTQEKYALSKMKFGGTINKEKAKTMAAAAFQIAQKFKREAGGLAQGLNTAKQTEGTKRLMKMEHEQEAPPVVEKKVEEPSAGSRIAALHERLHIQHAGTTAAPSPIEPTRLPDTPAGWTTAAAKTPDVNHEPTHAAPVVAPTAPLLSQFSSGLTGGESTTAAQHEDHATIAPPTPVLRNAESDQPEAPAEPAPTVQLPDTSHVDEGLPF